MKIVLVAQMTEDNFYLVFLLILRIGVLEDFSWGLVPSWAVDSNFLSFLAEDWLGFGVLARDQGSMIALEFLFLSLSNVSSHKDLLSPQDIKYLIERLQHGRIIFDLN